ncbi:hypothetical protein A2963_00290 [Candidatus Roizmanbacteria bacterium RIFCSPLOWO2_01_FULL_40_13]|nr:MAG: hypothetical protein A2963_00290 [Candidatus Roizmanbacteria bacterium RIFCSPLOWO2_01_FULL_40_13]
MDNREYRQPNFDRDKIPGDDSFLFPSVEPRPNTRQQNKIIKLYQISRDTANLLRQERERKIAEFNEHVGSTGELKLQVSEAGRIDFLDKLAKGEIPDNFTREIITESWVNTRTILDFYSQTMSKTEYKNKEREILGKILKSLQYDKNENQEPKNQADRIKLLMRRTLWFYHLINNPTSDQSTLVSGLDADTLKSIWEISPSPNHFNENVERVREFLNIILEKINPSPFEISLAFRSCGHLLYGKQYEYWEQLQLLKREARIKNLYSDPEVVEADTDAVNGVFKNTEIHGDATTGKFLTREILQQEEMRPKYKVRFTDNGKDYSVYFSDAYLFEASDSKRQAVVAYVPDARRGEGKYTVRTFYMSTSHRTWRYLPYNIYGMFGKGFEESSINLPIPMQKSLALITTQKQEKLVIPADARLLFYGTSRSISGRDSYFGEVVETPRDIAGNFYIRREKIPPEKVNFANDEDKPDFNYLVDEWLQKDVDGKYHRVEIYSAKYSKKLHMIKVIYDDKTKVEKVWFAMIDDLDNNPITNVGIRRHWTRARDLFTPLIEYKSQSHGYGKSFADKHYVDMWDNYISKMPWVKERKLAKPS